MSTLQKGEAILEEHRERMIRIRPAIQALEAEIARLRQAARPDGVEAVMEAIRKTTDTNPSVGTWNGINAPLLRLYNQLEEI